MVVDCTYILASIGLAAQQSAAAQSAVLEMMHGCIYAALLSCWDLGGPGLDWIDIQETLVEIYILVM